MARCILGHGVRLEVTTNMPSYIPKDFIAAYDPSQRAIWLSMKAAHDMAFNVGHEAMHDLRNIGAITEGQWKVLVSAARAKGFGDLAPDRIAIYRKQYQQRYGMFAWFNLTYPTTVVRYGLTLEVMTPDGTKTGSRRRKL